MRSDFSKTLLCSYPPDPNPPLAPTLPRLTLEPPPGTRPCTPTAVEEKKKVESKKERIGTDKDGLTPEQVNTLLDLIEETDFAQVDLEIGAFELHVKRKTEATVAAAPAAAPVAAAAPAPSPVMRAPTPMDTDTDTEDDASMIFVPAPSVGVFRRGKYVKGKRVGKGNTTEEGDVVKKGQVLAYVEKLGTFEPVVAPQAGEISIFLREEGDAVGYGADVVEISPFFGGHIIGDSKYA